MDLPSDFYGEHYLDSDIAPLTSRWILGPIRPWTNDDKIDMYSSIQQAKTPEDLIKRLDNLSKE